MWGDDRWQIRREEDHTYWVRSVRLGCDHRCFCCGMCARLHLVLVEPLTNQREDISIVVSYKCQQTSVVLSWTWSSSSPTIDPYAFTTATPFSVDNSEIEIDLSLPKVFGKKIAQRKQRRTTEIPFHALDLRNNYCLAFVRTKTNTRAMPNGQYGIFKTYFCNNDFERPFLLQSLAIFDFYAILDATHW